MNKIVIDGHEIGGDRSYIIAEIGSNHNQSLELAFESIDAAIECGADAVKFQSIDVDELYYQPSEQTKALHQKIDMDEKWHGLLSEYCTKKGITFFSAPTYLKAIDILEDINVPLYKLASAQIGTFPQLVEKVAATGKPVILSTGIVTMKELTKVVEIFKRNDNDKFIILHCNSIYPTPYDKVHLNIMNRYRDEFDCIVGFSDHTLGIELPIAAVALGANIIEKHFTLDRDLPGPDHRSSLEPEELRSMITGIRKVESALGNGIKRPSNNELEIAKVARKSLIVAKDLKQGTILTKNMIVIQRPGTGLSPSMLDFVVGRRITKDVKMGSLLSMDLFE